jgi:hypothetical protein
MRGIIVAGMFVIGMSFGFVSQARADLLPPECATTGCHAYTRCYKFLSADSYVDRMLIAVVKAVQGTYTAYAVHDSVCLDKGYKFNSVDIRWASRDYVAQQGMANLGIYDNWASAAQSTWVTAKDFKIAADTNFHILNTSTQKPFVTMISDTIPLQSQEIWCEYVHLSASIACGEEYNTYYEKCVVTHHNNGSPDTTMCQILMIDIEPCFIVSNKAGKSDREEHALISLSSVSRSHISFISQKQGPAAIAIYSSSGKLIQNNRALIRAGETVRLPLGSISPGMYWIRIQTGDQIISKPVMIAR